MTGRLRDWETVSRHDVPSHDVSQSRYTFKYYDVGGHPFVNSPISTKSDVTYTASTVYDSVFDTSDLKHWNSQSYVQAYRRSFVPPAEQSIFAGTEL